MESRGSANAPASTVPPPLKPLYETVADVDLDGVAHNSPGNASQGSDHGLSDVMQRAQLDRPSDALLTTGGSSPHSTHSDSHLVNDAAGARKRDAKRTRSLCVKDEQELNDNDDDDDEDDGSLSRSDRDSNHSSQHSRGVHRRKDPDDDVSAPNSDDDRDNDAADSLLGIDSDALLSAEVPFCLASRDSV